MRARWIGLFVLSLAACDRNPQGSGISVAPARAVPEHAAVAEHPQAEERAGVVGEPEVRSVAGGLSWEAQEPLAAVRPSNEMRVAEYVVRDHPEATLTVFHFAPEVGGGGDVQANVDRWLGQITQPDGRPTSEVADIQRRNVAGVRVTTVDARGTFAGMGMGGGAHEGWRLLGAIAEGPEGHVFFKLTGPEADIALASDAFEALVASIHPI